MKNLFKYLFFLIGGAIWISVLIFSIYTDLANVYGYNPVRIEEWKSKKTQNYKKK